MDSNRSTLTVLGALVGLIILIVAIFAAVGTFREGATKMDEQARAAGRPITLAETLAVTNTAALTETSAVTEAAAVAATAATTETTPAAAAVVTTTTAVTETALPAASTEVTTTVANTETAPAATAVTTTTEVATAEPATTTAEVTTTTAAAVAVTTPVTESAPATTTAVTATAPVTTEAAAPAASGEAPADVVAIINKATCFACHMIPGVPSAAGMIGPDLTGIGTAAATRVPGQTAEQYIKESITNPNAFIAPKCPTGACLPNIMLQNLVQTLTPEEIDKVVAYLASLK